MDEKSYNYIKSFIDAQIREINRPVELSRQVKAVLSDENINIKQFQITLMRLNLLIRRHNSNMFPPRIINQIINQIIKSENYKIELVNERLSRISKIIKPLILTNLNPSSSSLQSVGEVNELISELPEAKYLFVTHSVGTHNDDPESQPQVEDEDEDEDDVQYGDGLVEDFEETVKTPAKNEKLKFQQTLYRQLDQKMGLDNELLEQYGVVRSRLLETNEQLQYKQSKMKYLELLRRKLADAMGMTIEDDRLVVSSVDNSMRSEMSRFKLLVDSIAFKVDGANRSQVVEMLREV
ncbi:hypothetical protein PSN45_000575 [Yamadazyma tenuis]|uniref:Uncharacterized protein n=1 Tax=Candida tenuis (strain ATCC 10573 / BCRC 21748 / CBS 615 / JCM 9827 / NBRC 10315 / NRRL Y-1498 / VKM Y-70) TaxID=590646 RepID=G3B9G6_CANTC|nr:uncharacterized protein CANTEDRAFT_125158 [Yamadazyma tenuis ATCC 10573]EGV61883.1 hypothetical protein CANTEDRAFT_125158 [Yamadazyma tenuis ATCC 10573]WEJ93114.1 hypothetical protein PSN45_000575 [Yamadazyma tenuis]